MSEILEIKIVWVDEKRRQLINYPREIAMFQISVLEIFFVAEI